MKKAKRLNIPSASMSDTDLSSSIQEIYTEYMGRSSKVRLEWLVCAAFARGLQYSILDTSEGRLVTPSLPEGRKRSKVNKIGSWTRHMAARIITVKPEFEVSPSEMTMESINAAQASSAYLKSNMIKQKWLMKRYNIVKYCLTFGNALAYTRDYEDETRRIAIPVFDEEGEEVIGKDGKQEVKMRAIKDVTWEALLPHNVLCDMLPGELGEKFDLLLAFYKPLSYFYQTYGEEVEAELPAKGTASYDLSLLSSIQGREVGVGATELVYLQKPCRANEKGLVVKMVGNKVLDSSPWMYKNMLDFPVTHFRVGPPEEGEFWTQSLIKDQIPMQKDINEVASIIQENISNVGHKKWMNPIGSGVTSINDLSDEIVDYNPGMEPHQSEVTPLPNYLASHLNTLERQMEDVQLLHSVTRGAGTPAVRSKIGLDKLEEEDTTPLGIVDDFLSIGFEDLGLKILTIAAEKLDEPRLITFIGEGRKRTIDAFTKQKLVNFGGVSVRMVDGYLRSKRSTQTLVLEMFHNNMVLDRYGKPDPSRAMKAMQFAVQDLIFDKEEQHRQIQYDENEMLIKGEEVGVETWEYHLIHMDVLEEMMNGVEWKVASKSNIRIREVSMAHWEMHKAKIAEALGFVQPGGGVGAAQP